MAEFKTKLLKFQYSLKHDFFTFDNVLLLVAGIFCLVWTWGSISAMSRNWSLAQEVLAKQRAKALLELEVETAEIENEYYASAEYQELAARKYQNKQLPGEALVYLPANTTAALAKHTTSGSAASAATDSAPAQSNLQQWLAFLFGA